jgi:hypothetical protein
VNAPALRWRYARPSWGRVAHLVPEGATLTACGMEAKPMAKWGGPGEPAGEDRRPWPICPTCRLEIFGEIVPARKSDCCQCCVAAVERGEEIGHVPGPGACPHPRCDYCQGEE